MKHKRILFITQAAMIAAIYTVMTYFINALGLANGAIQIRISEALTILPAFTPAAVPGLFVGCLLSNTLTGCAIWDILLGSLATLIGAFGTRLLRKRSSLLLPLPPILANTLFVPFILQYVYLAPGGIVYLMLSVGIGEVISCGILGLVLYRVLLPFKNVLFPQQEERPSASGQHV